MKDKVQLSNQKKTYKTGYLFGLSLFGSTHKELLDLFSESLTTGRDILSVATPNPEQIVLSRKDHVFLDHLRSFSIRVPDGIGLVLASKILKGPSVEKRITGVDCVEMSLGVLPKSRCALIIGGRGYEGRECKSSEKFKIVKASLDASSDSKTKDGFGGQLIWHESYQDISNPTREEELVVGEILEKYHPAVVYVALGAPHQEAWVVRHLSLLRKYDVKIVITVGGAFDMLTGKIARAPAWLQAIGGEWFFRLIQEPQRLGRQLNLIVFVYLVILEKFKSIFPS